jgi:hypothetical protein
MRLGFLIISPFISKDTALALTVTLVTSLINDTVEIPLSPTFPGLVRYLANTSRGTLMNQKSLMLSYTSVALY